MRHKAAIGKLIFTSAILVAMVMAFFVFAVRPRGFALSAALKTTTALTAAVPNKSSDSTPKFHVALREIAEGPEWNPQTDEPALSEFARWYQKYRTVSDSPVKAALEAQGIQLAKARRRALEGLIQSDAQSALRLAAPAGVRQALPPSIIALLEDRVSGTGSL